MKKCMLYSLIIFLTSMFLCAALYADQIILKNSDKISGKIVQEYDTVVVIETKAMGDIGIKREFIDEIIIGRENITVEEKKPKLWQKEISAGYNKSSGNTQNAQFSLSAYFNRKTEENEFTIKADNYYSSSNSKMDAQKWHGMVRYAYSFWKRNWYHFYKLEGDHDRFANIDYRIIPSSGIGYWFSDTLDWKLMIEGAFGLEHTSYRDDTDESDEPIFVGRLFFDKKLIGESKLTQDVSLYPSLSEFQEYRIHSETAFINPINDKLSLKLSLTFDYDSEPPKNTKKVDTRFTSALQYSF